MLNTKRSEVLAFLVAAGSGEYLSSYSLCKLHRGLSYTARSGVDKNLFSLLHPAEVVKGVISREINVRYRGRFFEAQSFGF